MEKMFPQLSFTDHMVVRFKNSQQDLYLCVQQGEKGYQLSTKTLQLDNVDDPELNFILYYFTDAEIDETKLVLPVHQTTHVCLSMDDNKNLKISSLKEQAVITNEVIPLEDPKRFMVADERFFYLKSSGSYVALEAMNGIDRNHFLAMTNSDDGPSVTIKNHEDTNYPEDTLFSLDTYSIDKM